MGSAGGSGTIPDSLKSKPPKVGLPRSSVADTDAHRSEDAFRPRALLLDNVNRLAMNRHSTEEIVRLISARAMRFSLYSQLLASGKHKVDGVDTSVEWSLAVLVYSGFNMTHTQHLEEGIVHRGYPKFTRRLKGDENEYRIYTRSRDAAESIVKGGTLLASHRGHIVRPHGIDEHYVDLTGIFITKPHVSPSKVWLGDESHRHFVDFKLKGAAPVLSLDRYDNALLIPGPARFEEGDIERAKELPMDSFHESHPLWDVSFIARAFEGEVPEFRIPIEAMGFGELDASGGTIGGAGTGAVSAGGLSSFAASSIACLGQAIL